jgi:hypothetical protein
VDVTYALVHTPTPSCPSSRTGCALIAITRSQATAVFIVTIAPLLR